MTKKEHKVVHIFDKKFNEYVDSMYQNGISKIQFTELKRAFYSGILVMFLEMTDGISKVEEKNIKEFLDYIKEGLLSFSDNPF